MPLRIGFDMDGVLADFAGAFREHGIRLFGVPGGAPTAQSDQLEESAEPEVEEVRQEQADHGQLSLVDTRRREDAVWQAIEATENFWGTLKPLDARAVPRIHEMMLRHRWEVFFITQRPYTAGETVQRQTQRWLVAQGFDLPTVIVLRGPRGHAAHALGLDYHVDDRPQNCVDVVADSRAKPILIVPPGNQTAISSARKLGIGVAPRINDALDILDQATLAQTNPTMFQRIAKMVGWRI